MNYYALYTPTCWFAALLDCVWIIVLLMHLAKNKLNTCWLHFPFLLIPSSLAIYFFYKFQRYELPYAILTLGLLLCIYGAYAIFITSGQWKKGLFHIGIVLLTVLSITQLTLALASRFISPHIHGDLRGSVYQAATPFNIFRIVASSVFFLLICIIIRCKNSLATKKHAFLALSFLSISSVIGVVSGINQIPMPRQTIIVFFIVICIDLLLIYIYLQKSQTKSTEAIFLEEKKRFEENRYNDADAIWKNIRKIQHDITQHLTVISGYLSENDIENSREYVAALLPNVERMGDLIHSDNRVLDYLINSKLCALENTQVIISGSVGDLSDIADSDLACLMGNILDNAIEAIDGVQEKRIELLFSRQHANRIIICKNTVAKSVLTTNPQLNSTKRTINNHGYGTKIVSEIVTKYHGMIDYFEEFDMFGVQIILPVSSEK